MSTDQSTSGGGGRIRSPTSSSGGAARTPLIHYPKPPGFKEKTNITPPSQTTPSNAPPSSQVQPSQSQQLPASPPTIETEPIATAASTLSRRRSTSGASGHGVDDSDHDSQMEEGVEPQHEGAAESGVPPSPSSIIGGSSRHGSVTATSDSSRISKLAAKVGDAVLSGLRGSHDNGPLVEDHILETMDFDKDEDYVNEDFMERKTAIHRHLTLFLQFMMTVAIAFVTAMLMFLVSHSVEGLFEWKVESVLGLIEAGQSAGGYFALLFISLLFVCISAGMVAIVAPHARGGGVPYVLAYLNGTNVMDYFSWRIVLIKTVSLIFTIAGGLTLGMEGPFVFIGGGVAAILNSATDIITPFFPRQSSYAKIIRSIREERIFMAGGMAAGLAVAFDAPIAGVLFALEGATAFLSAPVVLRIFGCAMFASFFNDLGHTNFSKYIKNHNLLEVSNSGSPSPYAWTLLEVFPFLIIGIVGGIVGSYATKINMALSRWRHHHLQGNTWKDVGKQVLEIGIFCFITVTCWFVLPCIYGCRPKHELCDVAVSSQPIRCRQAHCDEGMYSEAATIVYSTSNQIAALLFDRSLGWAQEFHTAPLITYGIIYWLLVSTIYGAYVPGGLFVPSIVVGGMYGRVIGIACKSLFLTSSINPGVYSLLGAASMLGGFTRLALPVVIMMVELTGDATYLLPMMFCSVVGKFISDYIEPPLYPQHMALEKIPSLTDKLNPVVSKLLAKDIMLPAEKCHTMCTIERLSHVKEVLAKSKRVVFPLITPSGTFAGLILTRNVVFCLTEAPTYSTFAEAREQLTRDHGEALRDAQSKGRLDWHNDRKDYSATISKGSDPFEDLWINFTPYMDAGCMTARQQTPAKRLAALFRRVGLSHLCITDKNNVFRGLITRRSLITPPATKTDSDSTPVTIATSHHAAHGSHPTVHSIDEGHEEPFDGSTSGSGHGSGGGFSFKEEEKEH